LATFTPPIDAKNSAICPGEGWISCGWLAFDAWRVAGGKSYRDVAEAIGCATGSISNWKAGKPVPALHLPRIEAVSSVPPVAWTFWVRADGTEEPAPPASEKRSTVLTELGKTPDEIRASVQRCKKLLAEEKLSPTQHGQIEAKILSGLGALARLEERSKIEDHPDFESFTDLIHVALERTLRQLGVDPTGARTVFADNLEAAEAEQQKRAA
jgi:transcriptional regulator with XRE-family HTH domain